MLRRLKSMVSPASVLALIALFVALGGVSYAAVTINGNAIQNNSIPGAKLKNGAVTNAKVKANTLAANRLTAAARASLRGAEGARGPQGAAGAPGAQGAQGTPGTALAYAQVTPATPSLVAERTSGVTEVTRPAGGLYCLAAAPAVVGQAFSAGVPTRPTVASVEYGNTANVGDTLIVEVRGATVTCPANTFEVYTYRNGALANDVAFTMIVP